VYESLAVGPGEQPDYLNAVLELTTDVAAGALLELLQSIEHAAGRVRTQRWAARTLDLDLLLHGDTRQEQERLTLPHPRLAQRNFVVYPLCDLAPELRLPDGTALAELRRRLPSDGLRLADAVLCAEPGRA
jgi:2-amino-4-hydroxy-6-hydroxymethyldihydropteridine diphosphokinase